MGHECVRVHGNAVVEIVFLLVHVGKEGFIGDGVVPFEEADCEMGCGFSACVEFRGESFYIKVKFDNVVTHCWHVCVQVGEFIHNCFVGCVGVDIALADDDLEEHGAVALFLVGVFLLPCGDLRKAFWG